MKRSKQTSSQHTSQAPAVSPTATRYSPEVEAKRADYERLADSLAAIIEQSDEDAWGVEVQVPAAYKNDETASMPLGRGVEAHLQALWYATGGLCDPRAIRSTYVELRLLADQRRLESEPENAQTAFLESMTGMRISPV